MNIHVGREQVASLVPVDTAPAEVDVFQRHPLYGAVGWVCVIDPAERTSESVLESAAHGARVRPAAVPAPGEVNMTTVQGMTEADRRIVAVWAADCAERALPLFEEEAPDDDDRARDAISRARAFARGELSAAVEIRRRFVAGRAAHSATSPAGAAAARAAAQAAGVAHMGAHALGAAAYAAKAVELAHPSAPEARAEEVRWQLAALSPEASAALRALPPLGEDSAGPLGPACSPPARWAR